MDVKITVDECTAGSDEQRLTFPEVLGRLAAAGIERYRADLVRAEKVYYDADGRSYVTPAKPSRVAPTRIFSAADVDAAVRASQSGAIKYNEFCNRIAAAGCVDYVVSLVGRRAVYYGRGGEAHVEPFPT